MADSEKTTLNQVSLDDKYALDSTRAYMTGIEALVRLTILQRQRDADAGLNTAGFVSGYRGSPLGTLDQSMVAARVGGHVALIGVLAGFAGPVQTGLLMSKNLRVQGLTVGSREQQLAMISGIEANGIKPVISDTFPLDRLGDAFRHQISGKHFGKIAVEI